MCDITTAITAMQSYSENLKETKQPIKATSKTQPLQTKRTKQGNDKEKSGSKPSTTDPTQRIKGTAMTIETKDDSKGDCEEKVPQHEPATVISKNPQ